MTMQAEPSGPQVTVVNGGQNDPFTDPNTTQPAGASGSQQTYVNPSQQEPQQTQQAAPASAAPAAAAQQPNPAQVVAFTAEQEAIVQQRIAAAHSGLDRRVNALTKQLEDNQAAMERAQAEATQRERDAKLNGLGQEDQDKLKAIWAIEDRTAEIEKREKAVGSLYLSVEGLRLLGKYDAYVTEDDILAYTGDPTALEAHVKALAFDRSQDASWKKPEGTTAQAAASAGGKGPAGATATQDIGAAGQQPVTPQLLTTQGQDSMAANIKSMFNDNGPNVPWSV